MSDYHRGDAPRQAGGVGLVEAQQRLTVGEYLVGWLKGKRAMGYKPASLAAWSQTVAVI
jgi:hypothetical protein